MKQDPAGGGPQSNDAHEPLKERRPIGGQGSVPNLLEHRAEALPALRDSPPGLFVDFDGTISQLAATPDLAFVSPRAARSLRRLAGTLPLVCVISGRAVYDLREKVGVDQVLYVGNHGAEHLESGRLSVASGVAEYSDRIARLLDSLRSRADIPGVLWENKRYSAAVHFRATADPDQTRRALQASLDAERDASGLQVFWGKMLLEIRPPAGLDKGHAVRRLVRERGLRRAVFVGDDRTDLDALIAMRELSGKDGFRGIGVVVVDQDTRRDLVSAADYTLNGVPEVEELLEWLAHMTR